MTSFGIVGRHGFTSSTCRSLTGINPLSSSCFSDVELGLLTARRLPAEVFEDVGARIGGAPFAQACSRACRHASRRISRCSSLTASMTRQAVGVSGRHPAEQLGLVTQRAKVGQAVATVRNADDQVPQHHPRGRGPNDAGGWGAIPFDSARVHPNVIGQLCLEAAARSGPPDR